MTVLRAAIIVTGGGRGGVAPSSVGLARIDAPRSGYISPRLLTFGFMNTMIPQTPPVYTLTVACQDTVGLAAATLGHLAEQGLFITDSAHHGDPETGLFSADLLPLHQSPSR